MRRERRTTARMGVSSCVHLDDDWDAREVVLADICERGLRCRGQEVAAGRVRLGETIRCRFVLPTGGVECWTRVAWVEPELEMAGLFFTSISDASLESVTAYCSCPF